MDTLYGCDGEAVICLLNERLHTGYEPQKRTNRKVGLIVEGGGMRGVISAGSLLALDLMGLRNCFDAVFAVSAGSVNAAYFLSGQGREGISVYFDSISNRRFFNPLRFWKIVDVDYVYDSVVRLEKPLDEQRLRACAQEFYVTATNLEEGKNILIDVKRVQEGAIEALKASSALPILYNRRVIIDGQPCMDGGFSGGLPVDWAIEKGCTDLVVLLSRLGKSSSRASSWLENVLFKTMVGLRYPHAYRVYREAILRTENNRKLAMGAFGRPGIRIVTIYADEVSDVVGRTTIDRRRLLLGAGLSAASTIRLFGGDEKLLSSVLEAYR